MQCRTFAGLPSLADAEGADARTLARLKGQGDKVHEEAGELMVAAKEYAKAVAYGSYTMEDRLAMLDERADLVQAIVNFDRVFEVTDDEAREAQARCEFRNAQRGRY